MMKRTVCAVTLMLVLVGATLVLTGCPKETERSYAGIEFVWCPAGTFYMGSIDGDSNELPVHRVEISQGFWMAKCEITQELWQTIMGSNPSRFKDDPRLPVENVSWKDVYSFIGELNRQFPERTFRLPTEAEWEYACRAGGADEYGFGDDAQQLQEYGWYTEDSDDKTHVGEKKLANDWGLYDMHGNLAEWTSDWYGAYTYTMGTVTDPTGPESGSSRVIRGGAWNSSASACRSSARDKAGMDTRNSLIGVRLVME